MTLKIAEKPDSRTLEQMLDSINEIAVGLDYLSCRAIQEDLAAIWEKYGRNMGGIWAVGNRMFVCSDCMDEYDVCYECQGYNDDYYMNEDGELVCACDDCPFKNYESEE